MQKRVYFRTRGGPTHGWGNIFRLVSFAEYCRQQGQQDLLFFVEGPPEVTECLENLCFKVISLGEDVGLVREREILKKYPRPDVMVMEMLDCTYERQAVLKEFAKLLVVFDDLLDQRYCADLVICGQDLPGYGNQSISDQGTRFFTGPEYFMCAHEFLEYVDKKRIYTESVRKAVVLLGGGLYEVAFIKAAHAFADLSHQIAPTFVLGYGDYVRLQEKISVIVPSGEMLGGVEDVGSLLWGTDVAIVSAGYCKLEAAITGTPAVMVATQWHQIPLAERFHKRTGMPYVGYMGFFTPRELRSAVEKLENRETRKKIADRARRVIDGRGVERLYRIIFASFENKHYRKDTDIWRQG